MERCRVCGCASDAYAGFCSVRCFNKYIEACDNCGNNTETICTYLAQCPICKHVKTINENIHCRCTEVPLPSPYASLEKVFIDAKIQASEGKGKERHAEDGKSFEKQDICQEARDLGLAYPIGQARKKAKESMRLEPGHAYQELLGAINYLAAAAIVVREQFSAQK